MSARTEPSGSAGAAAAASISAPRRKPRFALFIATAGGLGYLPKAPGTFGSLAGLALAVLPYAAFIAAAQITGGFGIETSFHGKPVDPFLVLQVLVAVIVAAIGVWVAGKAARFWEAKDPQKVVIDEVSGQHLTILLGCDLSLWSKSVQIAGQNVRIPFIPLEAALNWKYLLLGFILFRVFDIWKPFPARQAEALPGGWGIMADDWVAGIYAGIGLWIARAAGL
jgi:phosphatidylglycerophosphatase A